MAKVSFKFDRPAESDARLAAAGLVVGAIDSDGFWGLVVFMVSVDGLKGSAEEGNPCVLLVKGCVLAGDSEIACDTGWRLER